jgi:uncharacterized protein YbjT (DUF2867 family)
MMGARLLIAGSTGLVGEASVHAALHDARVTRVVRVLRRPAGPVHPRLSDIITGDDLLKGLPCTPVDAVICCLGTTIRNVDGDKARFAHVDKELVLGLARWAKAMGVSTFCVVSAMGADARSRIFYSRVKGEMEDALMDIGLERTVIMQPSILTGPRKELRIGERIGIALMTMLTPLMVGRARPYRPMPADVLGRALVNAALHKEPGILVLRYDGINAMAASAA